MSGVVDNPFGVFGIFPVAQWFAAYLGEFAIAVARNLLLGYGERRRGAPLLLVLSIIVSMSVLLIADIDSPRADHPRTAPQPDLAVQPITPW